MGSNDPSALFFFFRGPSNVLSTRGPEFSSHVDYFLSCTHQAARRNGPHRALQASSMICMKYVVVSAAKNLTYIQLLAHTMAKGRKALFPSHRYCNSL
jgi:hypothetical protein